MSPKVKKLIGQAVVQLISGDKQKAEELSAIAHELWFKEDHLHASISEIITHKSLRKESEHEDIYRRKDNR